MFVLYIWQAFPAKIITFNPESELLISQKYNLPKPITSLKSVEPSVGGHSIFSMNGGEWKRWWSLLNPGFSSARLMGHVPYIVDYVEVFCGMLVENVGSRIILHDDFTKKIDV